MCYIFDGRLMFLEFRDNRRRNLRLIYFSPSVSKLFCHARFDHQYSSTVLFFNFNYFDFFFCKNLYKIKWRQKTSCMFLFLLQAGKFVRLRWIDKNKNDKYLFVNRKNVCWHKPFKSNFCITPPRISSILVPIGCRVGVECEDVVVNVVDDRGQHVWIWIATLWAERSKSRGLSCQSGRGSKGAILVASRGND